MTEPNLDSGPLAERAVEDAVAVWIDRLISGEELDPLEVLAQHPGIGHEILDRLESFISVGEDSTSRIRRLGDFRLLRELGRGGMGVVYEAHQESMDRRVALKILPAGIAADRTAFLRFMREAQTAGKLKHPAIVAVYSLGIESDTPYYAMEKIEGESLSSIIEARREGRHSEMPGVFSLESADQSYFIRVAEAFSHVAEGLHHAHREGVIHRDIKPSNLMVDSDGRLRILDFGLAYFDDLGALTLTGEIVGTPLYMSPEQARRESIPIDLRTDIYSLGASLYEMLTLQPPFRGKDRHDILRQIVDSDPAPPRIHASLLPRDLEIIVLKCMRRRAAERYSTAQAMSQDLARFVRGEPIEARLEAKWARYSRSFRRQRNRIAVALVLLLALVTLIWLVAARSQAERDRELALYPEKLRATVGKLDSGLWIRWKSFSPLYVPGIDFLVFEADDFRDVREIGGMDSILKSIDELEQLIQSCPEQPEARYHLARACWSLERMSIAPIGRAWVDRASAELDKLLELEPNYAPAMSMRAEFSKEMPEMSQPWQALWRDAEFEFWNHHHGKADEILTKLIDSFNQASPPYTGFLARCYLRRASARLALERFDLAEEDCVLAGVQNSASRASDLLLAKVYLQAGKSESAEHTFRRLAKRLDRPDILPFWIASVYLSQTGSEIRGALAWAEEVRDTDLRERLLTYLYLRMGDWKAAINSSGRAIRGNPDDLVPRQLLASALIKQALEDKTNSEVWTALAKSCSKAIELDPSNRRSHFLLRAAWELLRREVDGSGAIRQTHEIMLTTATMASVVLPSGSPHGEYNDDFSHDFDPFDGRPFTWREIQECCPGKIELHSESHGLRLTQVKPDKGDDAWLVTEEVFAGDLELLLRLDVGDRAAYASFHVDLGTSSLYFAGVSRNDGECVLGKMEYGQIARKNIRSVRLGKLPDKDTFLEIQSRGSTIEFRLWNEDEVRPVTSTLRLEDNSYRFGSIGISSESRPAIFRYIRLETSR